ncbi:Pex12 amino terminal region-domain-containing protein [Tuber brumale]|nr:Pex12 amino terminal region-domain-containing protein [Tuber brumale]
MATITATVPAATTTTTTTTTTAATAITANPPTTDWQLAHQHAQQRITRLQEQRAREASGQNRVVSFFGGRNGVEGRPAFRVGQLDTELLDEELLELMKGQLWNGLKYFRPSLKESYEPEFLLLLRAALFKLTIWDHNATYGAALQNLVYVDARSKGPIDQPPTALQKSFYGLITVGGRYMFSRMNLFLLSRSNPEDSTPFTERLSNLVESLSTLHSGLTLLSFTAFLVTGHYRTLLDRALRMRLVSPTRLVSREVSFEYLNRQLVWHAFTEFLLFILPLIRVSRWRRWWARLNRKIRSSSGAATTSTGEGYGELNFLPERTCAICHKETDGGASATGGKATDVVNPYEAVGCGHIYCYVCLAGKIELEEGDGWTCLRCGNLVKRCRPWRGGLKGLTSVGDWGEEVVDRGRVGFGEDGPDGGLEIDTEDLETTASDDDDGEGTERADEEVSDIGSEDTERPNRGRPGFKGKHIAGLWAEETLDESVYNTAEGEDE